MTKKWLGVLAVAFGMCAAGSFAPAAHAQDNGKVQIFAGYSFTTNNIDSSIQNFEEEFAPSTTGLHGYTVSGVWNLSNNIGLEANFDGHNGSPTVYSCTSTDFDCGDGYDNSSDVLRQDLYVYTFGPKFTVPVGNWSIWGHVLAGGMNAHEGGSYCYSGPVDPCYGDFHATASGFAFKTGGGLDWNHGFWGVRLVEIDYVHLSGKANFAYDDSDYSEKFPVTANNVEVSAGILFNFGRK